MTELKAIAAEVIGSVREFVTRSVEPITRRLDALEQLKQIPERGERGEKGIDGAPGPQGFVGDSIVGPQGVPGESGPLGEIGERGADGLPGPQGDSIVGPQGVPGESVQGPRGEKGLDGALGLQGLPGVQGAAGESIVGERGETGERGADGLPGPQGPAGESIVGPQGEKGSDGHDGKSVYELARVAGFAGTEMQWFASLRGADGPIGEKGVDGRDGRDGIGICGDKGAQGERGEQGKDGIEIKFLDAIDPSRSYPAGTYACHDGAIIRSVRTTGPIKDGLQAAGWKMFTDGESDFEIVQSENLRTFTFVRTMASGRKIEKSVTLPVILDCGIWLRDRKYVAGDAVTRDGSLWVAQCATTETPGESKHWRLAVKRGRDGKDGSAGERGMPGRDLTGGNGLRR